MDVGFSEFDIAMRAFSVSTIGCVLNTSSTKHVRTTFQNNLTLPVTCAATHHFALVFI